MRQAPPTFHRKSIGLTLAILGIVGLVFIAGLGAAAWYLLRQRSPEMTSGGDTIADAIPDATPALEAAAQPSPAMIPGGTPQTDGSPALARSDHSSALTPQTLVSQPGVVQAEPPPPAATATRVDVPETSAPIAMPAESDYASLDPLPVEGEDGAEAGHRLSGMYRREGGTRFGANRPLRVRRRVPIGTPAERPALRMLHHIINAEESFKNETGKYGTLADLARTGELTPAVTHTLRRWSKGYYRYEIRLEDGGFTLLAYPLSRREARTFIADDSGIIRPSQ